MTTPQPAHDPYAAWRHRDYRLFSMSWLALAMAGQIEMIVVGIHIYDRTSDPLSLGWIGLVRALPVMLLAIAGGQLADRTPHHVRVAISGLAVCAVLMVGIATGMLSFAGVMVTVFFAGLAQGCTSPSRDILVKKATPPGATGKVFGFVYSGLDAGSTTAPLLFGALLDRHAVQAIFLCVGLLYAFAIFSVLTVSRHPHPG